LGVDPDRKARREDVYQKAVQYKQDGDCASAIPLLEPFANRGHGFEVAQLQLGQCYLETAKTAVSPALADDVRQRAAEWILKAANSQVPAAQELAAHLYADGTGVKADPVEAAKWLLLVERNPVRRLYGPLVIDADLEDKLKRSLSPAQRADAEARASRWQPVEQPTNVPPDDKEPRRRPSR
jgi:thioredoxin-like negative regulator of GroEL